MGGLIEGKLIKRSIRRNEMSPTVKCLQICCLLIIARIGAPPSSKRFCRAVRMLCSWKPSRRI